LQPIDITYAVRNLRWHPSAFVYPGTQTGGEGGGEGGGGGVVDGCGGGGVGLLCFWARLDLDGGLFLVDCGKGGELQVGWGRM